MGPERSRRGRGGDNGDEVQRSFDKTHSLDVFVFNATQYIASHIGAEWREKNYSYPHSFGHAAGPDRVVGFWFWV